MNASTEMILIFFFLFNPNTIHKFRSHHLLLTFITFSRQRPPISRLLPLLLAKALSVSPTNSDVR